jgi:hypothetical protein
VLFGAILNFCCRTPYVFGTKYRVVWQMVSDIRDASFVPGNDELRGYRSVLSPHSQPTCPHGVSKIHNHSDGQKVSCIYSQSVLLSYTAHLKFTCFPSTSTLTGTILCFPGVILISRTTLAVCAVDKKSLNKQTSLQFELVYEDTTCLTFQHAHWSYSSEETIRQS